MVFLIIPELTMPLDAGAQVLCFANIEQIARIATKSSEGPIKSP